MLCRGTLLLLLLIVVSGCAAARPVEGPADGNSALASVLAQGAIPMWPHVNMLDKDCKATCDGADMPKGEPSAECWGTNVWTCKGNTSIFVSKCEGHFLGFHVPDKQMWVGVCEGLGHKFAHWTRTCPKSGSSHVHFMGKGCLGTASTIVKGIKDDEVNRPKQAPLQPAQLTALLPRDAAFVPGRMLDPLAAALPRLGEDDDDEDEGEWSGSIEGRCDGRGGEVYGVKWGDHAKEMFAGAGKATGKELFNSMQGAVEAELGAVAPPQCSHGELGRRDATAAVAAAAPPPPPAPEAGLLTAMVGLASDGEHERECELTCNGKQARWRGLWPCWGELSVDCSSEEEAVGGRSGSFSAECKGLWTGWFGKMCFGLTQTHSTKTWASGSAEADGICTGHLGVRAKKSDEGAAMGQWCHGRSVGHVAVEKHATTVEEILEAI